MKIVYHSLVNGVLAFMLALFIHDYFAVDFRVLVPFILLALVEAGAPDTDITRKGSVIAILAYELLGLLGLKRGHRESFHQLPGLIAYATIWVLITIPVVLLLHRVSGMYMLEQIVHLTPYIYTALLGAIFTFIEHIYFDTSTRQGIVVFGKRLRGIIKYNYTDDELTGATVTGVFATFFLLLALNMKLAYAAIVAFVFGHLYVPWSWRMLSNMRKKKSRIKRK